MNIVEKITIIIPVYNSSDTLGVCITSVLEQDYDNWELILVDDGSTDGSFAKCIEYANRDKRIIAFQQPHQGVSAARNFALEKATGTHICFVDADDSIEPNYLSAMLAYKDSDMVLCGYFVDIYENTMLTKQEIHLPEQVIWKIGIENTHMLSLFLSGMIHINCNKLLRNDIIQKNKLRYQSLPVNEDYLFMLSFLEHAQSLSTVRRPLYHWNRFKGKITGVDSLPDNLIEIYNKAHIQTRKFFNSNEIGDHIFYFSYNFIVLKLFTAFSYNAISKKELKIRLSTLHSNALIKSAFEIHKPIGHGERLMCWLQKKGYFRLYYWLFICIRWKNK